MSLTLWEKGSVNKWVTYILAGVIGYWTGAFGGLVVASDIFVSSTLSI
jgi:hypothetical protein